MKLTIFCKNSARVARSLSKALMAVSFILLLSTGTSWAFSTYEAIYQDPVEHSSGEVTNTLAPIGPSSIATDACLPLLETIRHTPRDPVADRNQRSAGKAAALGLVFGVRFALSPPKNVKAHRDTARLELRTVSGDRLNEDRGALAISSYRQCQKREALKALRDFRWER